jgi:hypothetical protein
MPADTPLGGDPRHEGSVGTTGDPVARDREASGPTAGRAVWIRLGGRITAQVAVAGNRRSMILRGVRSERTLRRLSRAVASGPVFRRYHGVLIDLTQFRHWSPQLAQRLATDVGITALGGRWLGYLVAEPLQAAGSCASPHVFRDLGAATTAFERHRTATLRRG